jgi:hypothetical protein
MAHKYYIDEQQRLGYVTLSGDVSGAHLTTLLTAIAEDPQWTPGYYMVFDTSSVGKVILDVKDTMEVRRISERYTERWGPGRTAIIATRDVVYWISKLFEVTIRLPGRQIKAFMSRDEAMEWLGGIHLPSIPAYNA